MEFNLSEDTIKVVLGSLNNSEIATLQKIKNYEKNFEKSERVNVEILNQKKYLKRIQEAISTFEESGVCI